MADESNGSFVVWLLAGAAIGATIALLYAPATGKETRRRIAKKTEEGRAALAESGKDVIERGRKLADEAADLFERGRKLVESTASNLTS